MECTAARRIHDVMSNKPFHILAASFTGDEIVISKNQVATKAEGHPPLMLVTYKTTGEVVGITEIPVSVTQERQEFPREV